MIFGNKYKNINKKMKIKIGKVFAISSIVGILSCNINSVIGIIYPPLPKSYLSDEFPASYTAFVNQVKSEHPNWILKALYTGLDWNQAVSHESYEVNKGISTVNKNDYGAEWLYQGDNPYNDGPYYTASKEAVAYTMDPRNSITSKSIFQFETLSYSDSHTVQIVEKILSNTPMGSEEYKNKYKKAGQWVTMDKTYAQIIYDAAKKYGVSPVHVASRIKQENSGNILNNELLNGSIAGYEGYYNFFNIGASPGNGNSAIMNGIIYAKNHNWSTPEIAINAGADLLKNKYIQWGQDTIYFQKYDVNNPKGQAEWLYGAPYMTNIMAPTNEGIIMYDAYSKAGALEEAFVFHIPVYNNMPSSPAPRPTSSAISFTDDNTLVYLDDPSDSGVNDYFPIRTAPDENSTMIVNWVETKDGAENRTKFTRIGIGVNTIYDKIMFPDGRIGYVAHKWVYEYNYNKVTGITLDKDKISLNINETQKLEANVTPDNAYIKDVLWSSSNNDIATVDANGNVLAKSKGEAVITATTKDQKKVATCNVIVNEIINVTDISFDKTEYTILLNTDLTVVPNFTPTNATNKEYTLKSSNENILKIEEKKIKAVGEGKAIVTFTSIDGGKTANINVSVISKNDDIEFEISNDILNENNILSKINVETKLKDFMKKITYNENILKVEVKDINSRVLNDEDIIGTGTTITVMAKDNSSVLETYKILIYGDVNGDGKISSGDYVLIKNRIMNGIPLSDIQLKGSDVNKDGKTSSGDYVIIKNHIMSDNGTIVQ